MIPVQPTGLQKVTAGHLQRQAMLYVRQSTLHQVLAQYGKYGATICVTRTSHRSGLEARADRGH